MPKQRPAVTRIVKIFSRTTMIIVLTASIQVLFVGFLGLIWGTTFLQKWISTPMPAIEPATSSHGWYVIFELKFPANYWAEGIHSFLFNANCPSDINSTNENGPTNSFSVDRTAEMQGSTVFIRRRGLYLTEIRGDAFGHRIQPSQETAAIYSLFTPSFEDAKRLQNKCKVSIRIDNKPFIDLIPIKIDQAQ